MPKNMHARMALHSAATAAGVGAVVGTRAHSLLDMAMWYAGGFIGLHVALLPFMAAWFAVVRKAERWVRGIVEEELIRFDLQTYERQLRRVFPQSAPPGTGTNAHDEEHAP